MPEAESRSRFFGRGCPLALTLISPVIFLFSMVSARADGPPYHGATSYRQTEVHVTYGIRGIDYQYSSGYDPDGANEPIQGILRSSVVASSQSFVFIPGGVAVEQVDAIRIPISPPLSGWYSVRVTTLIRGDAFSVGNSVLLPGNADGSFVIWTGALILDGGVRRGWGDSETLCHTELDSPWNIVADGVMGLLLDLTGLGTVGDFVSLMNTLRSATDPVCHTALGSQFSFEPGGAYLEGGQTYNLEVLTHAFASSLSVAAVWGAHVGASDYVIQVTDVELVSQPEPPGLPVIGELSALPNPVSQGRPITLRASDVVDPYGAPIVAVEFYRDVDADGELNLSVDEFLGSGSQSGSDWSLACAASWPIGIQVILARATTDVNQGVWGPIASLQVLVQAGFYTITATAASHGTLIPSGTVPVPDGGNPTFTAIPDSGYAVNEWRLDTSVDQTGGNSYTIHNVQANHTLLVTFRLSGSRSELTILSPNGGETQCQGKRMSIGWKTTGNCGDVRLELLKGGSVVQVIDASTPNDGSYSWSIPYDQQVGTDYRVRACCLSSGACDDSDGTFEIRDCQPPSVIEIRTLNDLRSMSENWGDGLHPRNGHYVLTNDVDAGATSGWNGGLGFKPIGTGYSDYFRGVFDGQGHKIINLKFDRPDEQLVGLFAVLMDSATVKDLTLEGDWIRGKGSVGAFVGECAGTLINCHSSVEVRTRNDNNALDSIGGLAGENTQTGTIVNCSVFRSTQDVDIRGWGDEVGGLVGLNAGTIEWSKSSLTTIRGYESRVGGIAGANFGSIIECASEVAVQVRGDYYVGGITGSNSGTVANCYATGKVAASNCKIGGCVGYNNGGTVSNCYAAGRVNLSDGGGLVGQQSGSFSDSFWNTDIAGIPASRTVGCGGGSCSNCYGLPAVDMMQQGTFTSAYGANWDFDNVWTIDEGVTYPQLRGIGASLFPPMGVTASAGEPDGVHVSWNLVIDAGVYRVYRADSQEGIPAPVGDWGSGLTFIDDTAVPEQTYYYWVKAAATTSGARESGLSNPAAGWRSFPPLGAPTEVLATDGLAGFVLVEWNPVPGANYYHVYRSDSETGEKMPLGDWQPEQSSVDSAGAADTLYYYWVTAAINTNGDRESDFGGPDTGYYYIPDITPPSVLVSPPPQVPCEARNEVLSISASDDNDLDTIVLHWNDSTDHVQVWTDIHSGSFNQPYDIGAFSAGQVITYWAEVWDESYNHTESGHETFTVQAMPTWYHDADGDGFGDPNDSDPACDQPQGYVADETDCDDSDPNINPDATEECDGVDNDCDGEVDEEGADGCTAYYRDDDGDGYGVSSDTKCLCSADAPYTATQGGDCDESDPNTNPDAQDLCEEDRNCDGVSPESRTWYRDADEDDCGDPDDMTQSCDQPSGYVSNSDDGCPNDPNKCDPGLCVCGTPPATENDCTNGIDDDCDGQVDGDDLDCSISIQIRLDVSAVESQAQPVPVEIVGVRGQSLSIDAPPPPAGMYFHHWSGPDVEGLQDNPVELTPQGDLSITAVYAPDCETEFCGVCLTPASLGIIAGLSGMRLRRRRRRRLK